MERIDLIDRLVPSPRNTVVVQVENDLYLIDTERKPAARDIVLMADKTVGVYDAAATTVGVAYCLIQFLGGVVLWITA